MLSLFKQDLTNPKVIIFGSQSLSFDAEAATRLRFRLLNDLSLLWIKDIIQELPSLCDQILLLDSTLRDVRCLGFLDELVEWLNTGSITNIAFPLSNVLLTPLTVISHLVEYYTLLRTTSLSSTSSADLDTVHKVLVENAELVGQCTGILTAVAVASSNSLSELEHYGAVAIRLAMLIGIVVDAQDESNYERRSSVTLSVALNALNAEDALHEVLHQFPETYVAIRVDKDRVTVTTSAESRDSLQQHLARAGLITARLGLRGRFHCHSHITGASFIIKICDLIPQLQFLAPRSLVRPVRTDTSGEQIQAIDGKLHEIITRSILLEQADWYSTFGKLMTGPLQNSSSMLLCLGSECHVPRTVSQTLGYRLVQANATCQDSSLGYGESVAVVGMACQVPGADNVEGYWQLLCDGKSQHEQIPKDRFNFDDLQRESQDQVWHGNFLQDYDCFDHKFFGKSPRETASTDPQHRLMLQVAYQAVEQSGYFNRKKIDKHIGCYIGIANADYEKNISCHAPNAYSATGNLKSFTAGKINHYFGWTGPSLTIDTACSASAVAVHHACQAVLSGECTEALAGGVNVITTPEWFQNLAGASFLSRKGQCKPFDSEADGYCRGEGVGAVFLKKLSRAISDGDQVLGVIRGSKVYQNENSTPITVPNKTSLVRLFGDVIKHAGLQPAQISYVEAHAAGTLAGDPVEYDSIRTVLGGSNRTDTLSVGSAKGIIGHAECASGVLAIIKTLMMIQRRTIPPQTGLLKLNPALHASEADNIDISTKLKAWDVSFPTALINNFGASGSNASILVSQAPSILSKRKQLDGDLSGRQPFMVCGSDASSIVKYCSKLLQTIRGQSGHYSISLHDLAFQMSRQSNKTLKKALIFSCGKFEDFETQVTKFTQLKNVDTICITRPSPRPVIMCFGGQSSTFIGLDHRLYENTAILRHHLNECHKICLDMGFEGIFPYIFQPHTINDTIKLQTALFAMQYASAKSWMECGIKVEAVVGLSFGELTALCISGVLSLQDSLKLVIRRAKIIQDNWSKETGSMIAVDGLIGDVQKILEVTNANSGTKEEVCIACYNGPRNFSLAGPTRAIDMLIDMVNDSPDYWKIKYQKLDISHAFHSALTDPILSDLEQITHDLEIRQPVIHIERATKLDCEQFQFTSTFVSEHMRQPTYYHDAVKRLQERYPSSIWLECGSNSSIASLTRRALSSAKGCHFQSVNISSENARSNLANTTMTLWKEGLNFNFWSHHSSQVAEYELLTLPPYQFEKCRHWMGLKQQPKHKVSTATNTITTSKTMWKLLEIGSENRSAQFQINTTNDIYNQHMISHSVAHARPICASTLQLQIAIDAIMSLRPEFGDLTYRPKLHGMQNVAPMTMDQTRTFVLAVETSDANRLQWRWNISSTGTNAGTLLHVSGLIVFRAPADLELNKEFALYERLISRQDCLQLLSADDAEEMMQGRSVYKSFANIFEYGEMYKGVRKFVSKGFQSAGFISKAWNDETWINSGLLDSFCQVAGMYVNNTTDEVDDMMYISSGVDRIMRSPKFYENKNKLCSDSWEVLSRNHQSSPKEFISDVFVFDARTGVLAEVILGIKYVKVSRTGFRKMVMKLSPDSNPATNHPSINHSNTPQPYKAVDKWKINQPCPPTPPMSACGDDIEKCSQKSTQKDTPKHKPANDISSKLTEILVEVCGLDIDQIHTDSSLEDLGMDSLMGMEMAREIQSTFGCSFPPSLIVDLRTTGELIEYLRHALTR